MSSPYSFLSYTHQIFTFTYETYETPSKVEDTPSSERNLILYCPPTRMRLDRAHATSGTPDGFVTDQTE